MIDVFMYVDFGGQKHARLLRRSMKDLPQMLGLVTLFIVLNPCSPI
jgi:hypothetical protein